MRALVPAVLGAAVLGLTEVGYVAALELTPRGRSGCRSR